MVTNLIPHSMPNCVFYEQYTRQTNSKLLIFFCLNNQPIIFGKNNMVN